MWYLNPDFGKDPDNSQYYLPVGGGFDSTNPASTYYDVRADIDAGGGNGDN
jgi:hypothetical protein